MMVFAQAALLVVAILLISMPELNGVAATVVLLSLFGIVSVSSIWRLHRAGILGMSPRQVYRSSRRPKANLLEVFALLASIIAMMRF